MKTRNKVLLWTAVTLVVAVAGLTVSMVRLDRDPVALEAQYASAPSRFVVANGVRFHIRDRGQGPAIVLIHGQSANAFTFEAWAEALAATHRIVSVDLPGHGLTGPDPQSRYSWDGMADNVYALTEELGLDRFVLAGNSLGGAVSLELALAHPEALDGLVLIDAIGAPREEPKPPIFEAYATPVLGNALVWLTPEWIVRSSLESTYGDPSKVTDAEAATFLDMMLRAGNREAGRQIVSYVPDATITEGIGQLEVPTLILWGGRDSWTLPKYAAWFDQHLPDAEIAMFDGLGHMPMAEDPAATLVPMRDFLARL
jgi:pimeloyl-ACP methyl ester carboxylesterase